MDATCLDYPARYTLAWPHAQRQARQQQQCCKRRRFVVRQTDGHLRFDDRISIRRRGLSSRARFSRSCGRTWLAALRQALAAIGRQHPGIPLHIIISAPVAIAIELGRQLTPAVPRGVVHGVRFARVAPAASVHTSPSRSTRRPSSTISRRCSMRCSPKPAAPLPRPNGARPSR